MKIDGPPNPATCTARAAVRRPRAQGGRCHETYDCVIVGAGASGLASAKYYRDRYGEDSKILIIDPLPDYGGHSTRNEFHVPTPRPGAPT